MSYGIGIAVAGAIILIVVATVLPTIFGAFGNLFLQTEDACVVGSERFQSVNAAKDWSGTTTPVLQDGTTTNCKAGVLTVGYLPSGRPFTGTAGVILGGDWETSLEIIDENSGINKLIITALPILAIVGVFVLIMGWYRGRSKSMMGG